MRFFSDKLIKRVCTKKRPWFLKRLMEIKEEQLAYERTRLKVLGYIHNNTLAILEELKGGVKRWKK